MKQSPVLFLHGIGGSTVTWQKAQALLGDYPSIVIDLPGFGNQTLEGDDIVKESIDFIAETIQEQSPTGKVVLVGHSYGGFLAAEFALHYPEMIERLYLVEPAGFLRRPWNASIRPDWHKRFILRLGARLGAKLRRYTMPRLAYDPQALTEQEAYETIYWSGKAKASNKARQALKDSTLTERFKTKRALPPATLLWGENDRVIPLSHGRWISKYQDIPLIAFKHTGHLLPIEDAKGIVTALKVLP